MKSSLLGEAVASHGGTGAEPPAWAVFVSLTILVLLVATVVGMVAYGDWLAYRERRMRQDAAASIAQLGPIDADPARRAWRQSRRAHWAAVRARRPQPAPFGTVRHRAKGRTGP